MSIYISLTTVPERLACWHPISQNLNSLLNQNTDRDYKVVINIPLIYKNRNIPYVLPPELEELAKNNNKLIINRIETDRGPIEKLLGCFNLATDPEDIIVALDDDHIYHEDMLSYILKKQEIYPEAVIGFRGDQIIDKRAFTHRGVPKYVLLGTHAYFPLKYDTHAAVPGHWHSVTYKRRFIEDDIFDDYFLKVAASDDHIISFYLLEKKREYVMVAWDKEDNFIPVNDMPEGTYMGKGSSHFPIKQQLGFDVHCDTGFTVFRKMSNDHIGYLREDFTKNWVFNSTRVYIQKPFTEKDQEPEPIRPKVHSAVSGITTPIKINDVSSIELPDIPPVITLTTIPSRLIAEHDTGIKKCIHSLLNQQYPKPYEIHFNVPYTLKHTGEAYVIPNWIKELQGDKFKIYRTEDYGPITKLYPAVERIQNQNTIIVVADDDLVYHPEMLIEQVKNQYKFEDSSVGYDGIDCWEPTFNDVRDHFVTAHRKNIRVKILQHYKTISYKRSYFKDDFRPFMDEYYQWNDDLLMAAYLGKHNIKRIFTYHDQHTPHLETHSDWERGNAAITFPLLGHTHHAGEEGCTLYRLANIPHYKKSPYENLIEKFIV